MKSKNLIAVVIFIAINQAVPTTNNEKKSPHKIIYMITSARNLSTIFMRTFAQRNDLNIFHEPFIKPFLKAEQHEWKPTFKNGAFETYEEVKKTFFENLKSSHVFVKGMVFMDYSFIKDNLEFVKNPNIRFFFFVRNPHGATISFYNRMSKHEIPQPNFYKLMHELFLHIKNHATHKPVIIKSEDFAENPKQTLQDLCKYLEIEYQPNMLLLNDLSNTFDGSTWNEQKEGEIVTHWHGAAISSSAIKPARKYETDAQGNPTFSEVEEKYRDKYRLMYEKNKPYYDLLMQEKEYFL